MKDILQDVVAKTHALGFLSLVKVNSEAEATTIESMAEDRSVILNSTTHNAVSEFNGTFGMPNLDKLALHLKNPEYQKDAKIDVVKADRNGEVIPTHIHFENASGDFENDYRFMNKQIIEEKLKSVKFKGVNWDITIQPNSASIARFKMQAQANSEETVFIAKTEGTDLKFFFGDASTHAGNFVFAAGVEGALNTGWSWPVAQVLSILSLPGDITMKFSDAGAAMITVDSGMATYDYILPAQSK